jgi:L-alanine-DL-glutamate epimerase-like enolase superfamily enzyme
MRIKHIDIFPLSIAFRVRFRHALASREAMSSLIVRARDEHGRTGYGECAPRSYVSGEDVESARRAIKQRFAPSARREIRNVWRCRRSIAYGAEPAHAR